MMPGMSPPMGNPYGAPMGMGGPRPPMMLGGPVGGPPAAPPPKPAAGGPEWQEHKAPDGRTYYYHAATKKSSWDKPAELKTPGEAACPWKEYTASDGSGKKYYFNTQTKKSVWTMPDELKQIKEAATMLMEEKRKEEAERKRQEAESAAAMAEAKAKAEARQQKAMAEKQKAMAEAEAQRLAEEAERAKLAPPPAEAQAPTSAAAADVPGDKYADRRDAVTAFEKALEEKGVKGDWSWAQAMGAVITDPRYHALKTIGEKKKVRPNAAPSLQAGRHLQLATQTTGLLHKTVRRPLILCCCGAGAYCGQVFRDYALRRADKDRSEKKVRDREAREEFTEMLKGCAELTSSSRYTHVSELLGADPRFKVLMDHPQPVACPCSVAGADGQQILHWWRRLGCDERARS
jgi:hypothetical protein